MKENKVNKIYILIATTIIATICIVSTTFIINLNKKNKYNSYINRADSALNRNRYDEAINLYKKAKEFSKGNTLIDNSIKLANIMKKEEEEEKRKAKEAREKQIKQREQERIAYEKQVEKEKQQKKKIENKKKLQTDQESDSFVNEVEKFFKSLLGN